MMTNVEVTIQSRFGSSHLNPPFIIIRRHPYEEPYHLNLVISASNGVFAGTLGYYCNAHDLADMGSRLMAFPAKIGDTYCYELGSCHPEDRFAFHFALRAYTLDSAGHCALQIAMNNNDQRPDDSSCSFSIRAEAAAINRLGRLFKTFGELKHATLYWSETAGELLTEDHTTIAEPVDAILMPDATSEPEQVARKVGNKLLVEGEEFHGHQDHPVQPPGNGPEEDAG